MIKELSYGEPLQEETRRGVALKVSFPGANPHPRIEPFQRLETSVNYFVGNDPAKWRTNVPVYAGVRYVDLYPGVDLELTGEAGRWAWRLVCRANCQSSLQNVRLRIEGADELALEGDALHLSTAVGEFNLPLLAVEGVTPSDQPSFSSLEDKTFEVNSPFALSSPHPLSVQSNSQDLLYATFLGGSGDDYADGLAVDSSGAIYVSGHTYSPDFPTTPGAFDTTFAGPSSSPGGDAFVVKLDPSTSTLIYATFFGGSGRDWGWGIAVDSSGAAYVTGETSSGDFPVTPGAFDTSYNGGLVDAFVVKLSSDGSSLIYATYLGGTGDDTGKGIAIDASGAAYVTGGTWSSEFPTTPGAFDTSHNGNQDAFVVKIDSTGSNIVYGTFLGGSNNDFVYHEGIVVDALGYVYLAGETYSSNFPVTQDAFDTTFNGESDVFVAKLGSDGSELIYATFLGGTGPDKSGDIALDSSGAVYVVGGTGSSDFPTTPNSLDPSFNGGFHDVFIAKLNPSGSDLLFATFLGGGDYDLARAVAVDGNGTLYLTGETASSDFPTTSEAFDITYNGGTADAFVVEINSTGNELLYSTFLGGGAGDWGQGGIAIDTTGAVYVGGFTQSSDFPTTTVAYDTSHNGGVDAFVVKIGLPTEPGVPSAAFSASPLSGPAPLAVQFTDQSTGNITSWHWDFGDGSTSTEQNPIHTYTSPGVYTVTLTVSGPGGSDTETKPNYITVNHPAPTADFTASPTSGTAPLAVQFTDQSTGDIMAWDWLFGDGHKSGARHPLHTYESAGTYTVSLTVTGPGGSDTETKPDYISVSTPPPVANFSASPLSGVAPLTVSFTDQSTGEITAWLWDFGDGSTSTQQNPTHTYDTPGTYTVTLTVTGPGGSDSFSRANYITVNPATETKTWTFMLYFAGDNNLSPYLERAIERMERVQPRDNLKILVLIDGWGNNDTYLYHIQYHPADGIGSTVITNPWIGWDGHSERNTGDAATLQHFITWARENYPADYYFLSIANHGRGTSGIAWDEDPSSNGDYLTSYSELGTVLSNATSGGADKIDVLMFDACLMALLEVDYEIKDVVDYIIASQNLGWSVFAYDQYMQLIEDNTDPATFATGVAQAYFNACLDAPRTVSVLDVSQLPALSNAVDSFAQALIAQINSGGVSQFKNIRDAVQVFDSYAPYNGPEPSEDEYIDLYHFAALVKTTFSDNTNLATAAQAVMDAINAAIIYEAHQSAQDLWTENYWDLDNAHGISLYFPPRTNSNSDNESDYERYINEVEWAFTVSTQWDEFLLEYFSLTNLPPRLWQDPGYAPMGNLYYQVYLPVVVKGQ